MRRPLEADKPVSSAVESRFYPVDGDYFVLRYTETITLNIQYIKLGDPADSPAGASLPPAP